MKKMSMRYVGVTSSEKRMDHFPIVWQWQQQKMEYFKRPFQFSFFLIKIIQLFFIDTGFDFFFNEIVVVLEMDE